MINCIGKFLVTVYFALFIRSYLCCIRLNNDALLASVFQGNMNYCPKSEDGVRGLRSVIYVDLKDTCQ